VCVRPEKESLLIAYKVVCQFEFHSLRHRVLDVEHSLASLGNARKSRRACSLVDQ
jgi:hypothetical protein